MKSWRQGQEKPGKDMAVSNNKWKFVDKSVFDCIDLKLSNYLTCDKIMCVATVSHQDNFNVHWHRFLRTGTS